jgi:hypothetical protein
VTPARLRLSRRAILAHRRRVGSLDERLPRSRASLRRAAWAGLTDSMPRAALLSIHARVEGTRPSSWEDPSLVQLWGPRYSVYVVAARDLPVFSLSRLPDGAAGRRRAIECAARLRAFVGDRRMPYGEAGRGIGVPPNSLRYAAQTGEVVLRWDGARAPTIWMVPPSGVDAFEARLELARRYLHVSGPTTTGSFARWAGIGAREAAAAFDALAGSLTPVATPDEASFREEPSVPAPARLLPSGDAYTLLHGADRELLVPDAALRAELWTPRVWPGAVLVQGEVVGTWRREQERVFVHPWRRLAARARCAVEAEADALPLPGLIGHITTTWGM